MSSKILIDVLETGVWGTVGPQMKEAGNILAEYLNMKYALITHSKTGALEALLRAYEITYGDKVIVASYSDPMDSLTVAAIGATPVFVDAISPETVSNAKAIIIDGPCDGKLAKTLKEKNILCIVNAGADLKMKICSCADAVVYDLSPYIGKGGAIVTNDKICYFGVFAYHTCGRSVEADSTALEYDKIIGGDFRITEWHACLLKEALTKTYEITPREFKDMKNQPFFKSDYVKKLTGKI